MTRNIRLSKELATQIRAAAARLDAADIPADAATARDVILELREALLELQAPIRALLDVATAGGDEDMREVPANADRALKRLAGCLLHAAQED
ncbi:MULTISPECIES: hypothetical protein [Streptomyces]|uniref:Uncharacterized protein n=1 Tax=Streptomyces hokutonensis TaxID=1306990 RepID=A0ABW6M781_9ACTN|nr:hypothetical protein OG504_39305 [Streptomyces sp. NBC_00986]